jgi:sodium/pantothenate symporter
MSNGFWILFAFLLYSVFLLVLGYVGGRSLMGLKAKEYVDQFYTAGRGFGAPLVAMMLAAGLVSAGTFVGTPGLAYQKGLAWVVLTNWQNFLNLMILGVVGKKIGIVARRIDARSYLDILGSRYDDNRAVLLVAGISLLIFLVPYASIQFVGGARLFEGLLGINYRHALVLIGAAVIAYTAFGGIKGTVLAAFAQGVVMTIAAVILFVSVVVKLGGLTAAMQALETVNPELIEPTAVGGIASPQWLASFAVLFGFACVGVPHGVMPALIYRSSRAMLKAAVIGALVVTTWTVFMATTGTLTQAVNPNLTIPDKAIPTVMAWALGPALQGVVLTGVVAALQSTVAAMVMLMSGSLVMDIYAKVFKPQATFDHIRPLARGATLAIGGAAFCLAICPPRTLEWIVYFAIAGLESSLFFPLLLGLYWKRVNTQGALAGMLGGLVGYILIAGYLKKLAFGMQPVCMGLLISLICLIVVTYLTPPPSRKVLQLYWGRERPK